MFLYVILSKILFHRALTVPGDSEGRTEDDEEE